MVESAFRSEAPAVIEWWEESNRRHQAWHENVRVFRESHYPDRDVFQRAGLRGGKRVIGLGGNESPGDGWRWSKRIDCWVPDKRYKAGKQHAEQLDALEYELDLMPGMPDTAMVGNRWHHPGVERLDGVIWVTWSCSADDVRSSQWSLHGVDDDLWAEALLSEYFLAKEAAT